MIRIFEGKDWRGKINFVDDKNVLVGYDTDTSCCEYANYTITPIEGALSYAEADETSRKVDLSTYQFDKDYFKEPENTDCWLDAGGHVVFKMVSENREPTLYLHLWNCHNGYYGHGFEFKDNETLMQAGTL